MLEVIGDILPLAIGIGISPFPIIAVILLLLTPDASRSAWLYLAGWLVGLAVLTGGAALLTDTAGLEDDEDVTTIAWGQVLLGLLLLASAWKQWRSRPAPGEESPLPGWMDALDRVTPSRAFGFGLLLSAGNPKNLLLAIPAAITVSAAGLSTAETVAVLAAFIAIASFGTLTPMIVYRTAGDSAAVKLQSWRHWLSVNNTTVMSVLLLVLGAAFVGRGLGAIG